MIEISESGDKIGEKLLMLLSARQRQELIKYLFSEEMQDADAADNQCCRLQSQGPQTETGSAFTEIKNGRAILLFGAAACACERTSD